MKYWKGMGWLKAAIAGWSTRTRVLTAGALTAVVALAVSLPLTLGSYGHASTVSGGVSPGTTPSSLGASGSSPNAEGSTSTSSVLGSSTTTVGSKPGSSAGTGSQSGIHINPTTVTPQTAAPGTYIATFSWHQQNLPAGTNALYGVSCLGGGFCMAVGDSVVTTTNGGVTWNQLLLPTLFDSSDYLAAVSCVTPSSCWSASADGIMLKTYDGGGNWNRQNLPRQVNRLTSLSCLDENHCWAASQGSPNGVLRTTDGGNSWASSSPPNSGTAQDVSCPSDSLCWASGSVDTVTPSHYLVPQPAIFKSSDGGASWSIAEIYGTNTGGTLTGMSCATISYCAAAGSDNGATPMLLTTTDGGGHWTLETVPTGIQQLVAVSCVTSGCWADGFEGSGAPRISDPIVHTTPGASLAATDFTAAATLQSLDCIGSGQCWVVGGSPSGAVFANT
jgi:photosystem II stability/assembly factor-like uncharacterized protein